jgi:hypothetical protein
VSWILTLFAHELPLLQVLQLWDFFLAQPPTIIIALAASIIILRVDGTKGCLRDQISLLSAPPAVDLLHCKVSYIHPQFFASACAPYPHLFAHCLQGPSCQLGRQRTRMHILHGRRGFIGRVLKRILGSHFAQVSTPATRTLQQLGFL